MKLKEGVKLADLAPQMVLAAVIIEGVFERHGVECFVTSCNDSRHGLKSLHYQGKAMDFRTKYAALNGKEHAIAEEVRRALGAEFDVVMEAVGTDNEHLHVEYDPE